MTLSCKNVIDYYHLKDNNIKNIVITDINNNILKITDFI